MRLFCTPNFVRIDLLVPVTARALCARGIGLSPSADAAGHLGACLCFACGSPSVETAEPLPQDGQQVDVHPNLADFAVCESEDVGASDAFVG
jgi:hypothetical protein